MNQYLKNLNRIEFVVTYACTGRCKHCSQGSHASSGVHIAAEAAVQVVRNVASNFPITSVLTFGGEPLLHPEAVCAVHTAAAKMRVAKRQLITNGFFSRNGETIKHIAQRLAQAGVNDILLSVDAFHQETIPLEPVREFAKAAVESGMGLRIHPAWVIGRDHKNPYNSHTAKIAAEFEKMGIFQSEGNIIFPKGNAKKYLSDYFSTDGEYADPYEEDPTDIQTLCVNPDGSLLDGNIYQTDVLTILENYKPQSSLR